ncbi:MAG: DUF3857 domain-containing protein [Bacteroidales bacterium]|nr:DUF3857 domain-containing protein [Bacteroidales bacterium]
MRRKNVFIAFLVLCTSIFAKELKYPVNAIPAELKENAHTVYRLQQQELEIRSEKSAVMKVTEVITILNENGLQNCIFQQQYDSNTRITSLKGRVYNENGESIKSLGSDEILDRSAIEGFSLYSDQRVKLINPDVRTYPFTVEYNYEMEYKQTLFLPSWSNYTVNTSYENSVFNLKTPIGYSFRFKEYNLPKTVEKTIQKDKENYRWVITNLKATIYEPMSSSQIYHFPYVLIASNNFQMFDTNGSSENWKDLGVWANSLLDKKDVLPAETIVKLKEMTDTCKNDFEKVKVVYEFMQNKTRYVNIAIGIGGWQPFDAATVDRLSYGDCKALSNYTKTLLSSIGINSFYTLVNAGGTSKLIDSSFSSSQFNHVFVCVPLKSDTVWLECTSQRKPCGFNGDFTDDRDVLIVDGENSKLVHTRVYPASENCTTRTSRVDLANETEGNAVVSTKYIGLSYDDESYLLYLDDVDKRKKVTESISLPSFTLDNFNLKENRSKTPSIDETLNISFANYMHHMGDNVLLPVNFLNKLTSIPDKVRNRKSEMSIRRAFLEVDTVIYQLPKNLAVLGMPEDSEITTQFGKFTAKTTQKGSTLTYIRSFELYKGVFPPEAYRDFRDFLEQIATQDNAVVSLKRQNSLAEK